MTGFPRPQPVVCSGFKAPVVVFVLKRFYCLINIAVEYLTDLLSWVINTNYAFDSTYSQVEIRDNKIISLTGKDLPLILFLAAVGVIELCLIIFFFGIW